MTSSSTGTCPSARPSGEQRTTPHRAPGGTASHPRLKVHIKWNRNAKQSTCQLNNAHQQRTRNNGQNLRSECVNTRTFGHLDTWTFTDGLSHSANESTAIQSCSLLKRCENAKLSFCFPPFPEPLLLWSPPQYLRHSRVPLFPYESFPVSVPAPQAAPAHINSWLFPPAVNAQKEK